MQYEQASFRDRHPLVNVSARPGHGHPAVPRLASRTPHTKPGAGERWGSWLFALGGAAITLSLVGAVWAANHYEAESRTLQLALRPDERLVSPAAVPVSDGPGRRGDVPQNGAIGGVPRVTAWRTATAPLGWNDLSLMLRTGLTDDEVIAACAGKQLTTFIGPGEEGRLRALGAGNRLVGYLQGQTIYNAPASAPVLVMNVQSNQVAVPPTSYVPAATPYPVVDYAARDRKVASLKKQIDDLDEEIRVARSRPNDYLWSGIYYDHFHTDGTSRQQAADSYIKSLEEKRADLRREKWRLEGR